MELPGLYRLRRLRFGFRVATAGARTLPSFIIIGAQKGGTSTLYRLLSQHPDVTATKLKEVHFFDLNFSRGTSWYAAQFPLSVPRRRVTGESSPYYLFHPQAPRRIRELLPEVKLIVLLRDPVTRAYSHYQHNRRKGREPLSFSDAVEREAERTAGELERLLAEPEYLSFAHQHYTYVERGHYEEQLRRYAEVFPRESLLILKSESFFDHPAVQWERLVRFLELRPLRLPESRAYNVGHYSEMPAEMRERLQRHFAPHNRRLAEAWGSEFLW